VFYQASGRAAAAEPYFKAIAAATKTMQSALSLSQYYASLRRFDDARKVVSEYLSAHADAYATLTTRLAAIDAADGQRAQALSKVDAVLAKYPTDDAARLLRARVLLDDGKSDQALAEATKIVTDNPSSPEAAGAYFVVGQIQKATDHPQEAIAAYEEVLKRQRQPVAAEVALAALHLAAGRVDQANSYIQQALAIAPRDPLVRSLSVRVALKQRDSERAKRELASLQKDFPNAPTVLDLFAEVQLSDRQIDAARASFDKAYALNPSDLEATAGLVQIDLARGQSKAALARIEDGLKAASPSPDLLVLAARVYGASGNTAKAEELLKRAIETAPSRLAAYNLLGQLYASQKKLDDAIEQFRKVAERNPKAVGPATMIGMLLEAEGRAPDAEAQYQKALVIDPTAPVAANNLAWIYAAGNRNLDKALELAQAAQRQLPDEPHVNDTLGWVYYRKNIPASAVRHLELSVQKDASDPSVFYHLGMAYEANGDFANARKSLQKALSGKAAFAEAGDARKALGSLGG
jgi:tetratricopeptide (TPR) repeat protein